MLYIVLIDVYVFEEYPCYCGETFDSIHTTLELANQRKAEIESGVNVMSNIRRAQECLALTKKYNPKSDQYININVVPVDIDITRPMSILCDLHDLSVCK